MLRAFVVDNPAGTAGSCSLTLTLDTVRGQMLKTDNVGVEGGAGASRGKVNLRGMVHSRSEVLGRLMRQVRLE